jgi:hypothetical protein
LVDGLDAVAPSIYLAIFFSKEKLLLKILADFLILENDTECKLLCHQSLITLSSLITSLSRYIELGSNQDSQLGDPLVNVLHT